MATAQPTHKRCFPKSESIPVRRGYSVLFLFFAGLTVVARTGSFTFQHPEGLLFSTEFAQPALVLVELAAFRDMRAHGLVSPDATFAGHSLGEYAALAAVGQVLALEDLIDIGEHKWSCVFVGIDDEFAHFCCTTVFLRGITMQNAVVRDDEG